MACLGSHRDRYELASATLCTALCGVAPNATLMLTSSLICQPIYFWWAGASPNLYLYPRNSLRCILHT